MVLNEQLFHLLPLSLMMLNCLSPYWVIWSGTFYINEIITIPIKLNMFWGLYHVELQSDILGKTHLSMSVPDFIQFVTDNFGIEILTATTLPLYYTIYVMYIFFILYGIVNVVIGIRNYDRNIDKVFIQQYMLYHANVVRSCLSIFFIWCLFSYYSTSSLCLNGYIHNHHKNGTAIDDDTNNFIVEMYSENEFGEKDMSDSVCSYSWNAITVVGTEFIIFLYSCYIFCKCCCIKTRERTGSGDSDTITLSFDNDFATPRIPMRTNRVDARSSINSRSSLLGYDSRRSTQNTSELAINF